MEGSHGIDSKNSLSRRRWLQQSVVAASAAAVMRWPRALSGAAPASPAKIAITLDLEMSRNFPNWDDTQWDYEKGNLDAASKQYALNAANRVHERGGQVHFFCVGRVLEQANVDWLQQLATAGHPIGNHTYDHINVKAGRLEDIQARFQRAPWLVAGKTPREVIRENIQLTTLALRDRLGIENRGFRTPGGYANGLRDRPDVQQLLQDCGFTWVSSQYPPHPVNSSGQSPSEQVYADILSAHQRSQPFLYTGGLVEIPMSPISDIGAFRNGRWKLEWFLESVRSVLQWTIENGAVFDFLAHPSCLGVVDPDFQTIDLICDMVHAAGERAALVDLDQIAAAVRS